jgi:hypothetical protein
MALCSYPRRYPDHGNRMPMILPIRRYLHVNAHFTGLQICNILFLLIISIIS